MESEEFLAVWTSFFEESLEVLVGWLCGVRIRESYALGHDDGANHAGAKTALLVWRDEVGCCCGHGEIVAVCAVKRRGKKGKNRLSLEERTRLKMWI